MSTMTIKIGDKFVRVPSNYATIEINFIGKQLMEKFYNTSPGPQKEILRNQILNKRMECYNQWT